jgi:hypothetical protein
MGKAAAEINVGLKKYPSPEGSGCCEAAGEGYRNLFTPHPALRATLSLQERDFSYQFPGGLESQKL